MGKLGQESRPGLALGSPAADLTGPEVAGPGLELSLVRAGEQGSACDSGGPRPGLSLLGCSLQGEQGRGPWGPSAQDRSGRGEVG